MEQAIRNQVESIFEYEIKPKLQVGQPHEFSMNMINELILDGGKFREFEYKDALLLKQFSNLSKLSCNRTGLTSIVGIPFIPSLHVFEVTDNFLSHGMQFIANRFPNLVRLEFGGNRVTYFDEVMHLKSLTKLESLGLEMNPISELPNYREAIFEILPQIKVLDGTDKNGEEIEMYEDDDDMSEDESEEDIALKDFYERDYEAEEENEDEDYEPANNADDDEADLSEGNWNEIDTKIK